MKVGTTAILLVDLDVDVTRVSKVIWTLKTPNATVQKEYPTDVTYADKHFGIPLTQQETTSLGVGTVKVEGQINYTDLAVTKTITAHFKMHETIATSLVTGNKPNGDTDISELRIKLVGEAIIAYTDGSGGSGGSGASWGNITGTLSAQTDLKNALDGKANVNQIPSLTGYATENYVTNAISDKADRSEIPSLTGYATQNWVQNQGYTTSEIDDNTTGVTNTWSASKINQNLSDYNKTNNFKTINNQSIIGTGNISISGGGSSTDVLAGKKILFVGDSICEGVGASGKPYPYWIQLWHPNATVYNLGQGGMSLCNPNNRENSLPYRIQNGVFTQYNGNVDYIILQGGINDTAYKMGWIRSTETSARTIPNTTQIWSALEYAVMYFRENNPSARIMFMSTHRPPGYTNKNWFDLLWEGCSEVCHKWGIEYIDLYSLISSNYVPNLQLHPTEEQHKLYYAPIVNSCLCGQTFCAGSTQTHAYNCDSLIDINFYSGTTSFNVGDTFSTSDWRINRGYDANYRMQGGAVTNNCYFDSSNVNMNVEGTYYVYVSYTENGRSASCVVEITVGATTRTLTSISATKSITSYTVGDDYSVSDVTVTASYSDGTTTGVTSDSTIDASNINKNIAGTYLINCSYTESGVTKYDSISVEYADAQTWTKTVEVPKGSKVTLIDYGDYYSRTDSVVLNPSTTNVAFDYELTVYDDSGNVVSAEYKLGIYDRYNGRVGVNSLSNLQNRFEMSYSKTYTSTSINAVDFVLTNYNTSYRCVIKMKNITVSITSSN